MSNRKINVLQFICSAGFYGAERWVLALAKNLDQERFKCDLAVTLEGNTEQAEIAQHFDGIYGDVFSLKMKNRFDLAVINKLVDLIKEKNIDIIHTHGYKSDIIGVLAARKAGIKVVITPHGFSTDIDFKLRTFMWLGCQFFRFADKVVPLSPQLMEDVRGYGVKEEKLVYVQNGVDLSEVEEQREKTVNPLKNQSEKRIGFIGQMIARKNIEHILDVFDSLASNDESMHLYLLGDGDKRSELEAYAKTLDTASRITFLGFRDDRIEWLHSFDLFVMSSVLEGIPRCLMEALAMGVPVAAYDIAGVDQLVKHKETGYLAELNNKSELANYWDILLNNEDEAQRISENGIAFVNQYYSAQRMGQEYMDVFTDMMERDS